MDLILWRHCEAAPGVPDASRPLTPVGLTHAARMAHWLAGRLPVDCRILVSPALRAQQTARALQRAFETVTGLAPGGAPSDVVAAARWPGAGGSVVIVGHQPTLGLVAAALLDGAGSDLEFRPGAIVWLSGRTAPRSVVVSLKAAVDPGSV